MGALDLVGTWPAPHAAAGAGDATGTLVTYGPVDRSFRWASMTKLLTAAAVLLAVEEGTLALDDQAGPEGATVRHLLAHASGLPTEHGPPLAAPGQRRIYSNAGFEILADLLTERAEMPFAEYLAGAVLSPLGLAGTRLEGSPAWGASGPLSDLLRLGTELLRPTFISTETLAAAVGPVFPGLAGVLPGFGRQDPNDWGLGFEVKGSKTPHWTGGRNSPETFGHFGRSGGFLWVDPVAGITCACLTDLDFGPWVTPAWPELSDAVLEEFGHRPSG